MMIWKTTSEGAEGTRGPTKPSWSLRTLRWGLVCAVPLLGGAAACFPDRVDFVDGSCELVPNTILDCRAEGYGEVLEPAGLVGYACTGKMRPDLDATMVEGVPMGLLCADKKPLADGRAAYCCTEDVVTCAYDPTMECDPGNSGFECYGNNRPESLNASLLCSNGTSERDLYHYCCTGQPVPSPCVEDTAVLCDTRLLGFRCRGERRPRGEDYGPNRSRADYYYPLCSIAQEQPNPAFNGYCCYMTLTPPVGATCVQHPGVPGCESGRFGFACYGPDTPEDDYPPMNCPDPGIPGRSEEGYEAKLYCCDFT